MKNYEDFLLEDLEYEAIVQLGKCMRQSFNVNKFEGKTEVIKSENLSSFWYANTHIVALIIGNTNLVVLPEIIRNLSHLKILRIVSSNINKIPESLGELQNLEYFSISNNDEDKWLEIVFPDIFDKLIHLHEIEIFKNFTLYLPPTFCNLPSLERLVFRNVFYYPISREQAHNPKAVRESFPTTTFRVIPRDFGNLKMLKELFLTHPPSELPSSIQNLKHLKKINFQGNNIDGIGNLDFLFEIVSLEEIDLSCVKIPHLPQNIGNLKNLRTLNLDTCSIEIFPESIGECHNLEELNILGEKYQMLPASIVNLKKLKKLKIGKKFFSILPKEMLNNPNLKIQSLTTNLN